MRPAKLTIQAFGPYASKEEIDFSHIQSGLYLITGPTGSGKTTIFDAMKYALYGVTSDDVRAPREMRSAHADIDTQTYVELEFEHAGTDYLIRRSPQQIRPKLRGTGTTEMPQDAYLEDLTHHISLASKDTDVTNQVIDLLGIDAEQFGRIVMIAQNDFARVLNAKTREREVLFRKIFGTHVYANIQNYLEERRKDTEKRLKQLELSLVNEISHVEAPASEDIQEKLQKLDILPIGDRSVEILALLRSFMQIEQKKITTIEREISYNKALIKDIDTKLGRASTFEQARKSAESARIWIQENEHKLDEALRKREELQKEEPQRNAIRLSIASLENAVPKYDELDSSTLQLNKFLNEQQTLNNELASHEKTLLEMQNHIVSIEAALSEHSDLEIAKVNLESKQGALERRKLDIQQLLDIAAHVATCRTNLERSQTRLQKMQTSFEHATSAYVHAEHLYNADKAGMLATTLKTGLPCPVCGSLDHPQPAAQLHDAPTEDELRSLETQMDLARDKKDTAAIDAERSFTLYGSALDNLENHAHSLFEDTPDDMVSSAQAALAELETELDAIERARENIERDMQKRLRLQEELEAFRARSSDLQKLIDTASDSLNALDTQITKLQTSVSSLGNSLQYSSKNEALHEISILSDALEAQLRAFTKADKLAETLMQEKIKRTAELEAAQKTLAQADDHDIVSLQDERDLHNGRLLNQEEALVSQKNLLANHRTCTKRIEALHTDLIVLEKEFSTIDVLAQIASGKSAGNLGKISFEAYVQSTYFDQVLCAANERLHIMSQGRYQLQRRIESNDNRSSIALDIDVLDRYTGTVRYAHTLSGGETFLASLSLALGLSDVIMQRAGGMHMDAMFIDEGFGTLDEETCQLAVNVLGELSSGDRIIGVISHVDDLKERISTQVRINKTSSGSSISIESP